METTQQQAPTAPRRADVSFQRFMARVTGPRRPGDDEVYAYVPAPRAPSNREGAVLA
jgi:hypothetical protein